MSPPSWATIVGVVATTRGPGRWGGASGAGDVLPLRSSRRLSYINLVARGGRRSRRARPPRRARPCAAWTRGCRSRTRCRCAPCSPASIAQRRFILLLLALFAAVALALAAVGVYGVISYAVARRTHEIGIRMALGARRADVLRLVIGRSLGLTACGIVAGLAGALLLSGLMASLLYGVPPTDLLTFAGVALLLSGVGALASYLPARRAMAVDPGWRCGGSEGRIQMFPIPSKP